MESQLSTKNMEIRQLEEILERRKREQEEERSKARIAQQEKASLEMEISRL